MTETGFFDHRWHGPPAAVAAATLGRADLPRPRILDGVAYVALRNTAPLPLPPLLAQTGPQLSAALLGDWM
jgi:hypothetical protein